MIPAQDIKKKYENNELTNEEVGVLQAMELHTDSEISRQYPLCINIDIYERDLRTHTKDLGFRREGILMAAWKQKYLENGWIVTFDSDYSSYRLNTQ